MVLDAFDHRFEKKCGYVSGFQEARPFERKRRTKMGGNRPNVWGWEAPILVRSGPLHRRWRVKMASGRRVNFCSCFSLPVGLIAPQRAGSSDVKDARRSVHHHGFHGVCLGCFWLEICSCRFSPVQWVLLWQTLWRLSWERVQEEQTKEKSIVFDAFIGLFDPFPFQTRGFGASSLKSWGRWRLLHPYICVYKGLINYRFKYIYSWNKN